ncbi:MAG: hypothetical protein NTX64_07540, partial [Elusimicrobia bacterium]|nr:hypothetical protein [Elusimicrobiota bacterium]
MGNKGLLIAAAFVFACVSTAKAAEQMKMEFEGVVYTVDKPALALSQVPKTVVAKRNNQQNMALQKMRLNPRPNADDVLIANIEKGTDMYAAVRELYQAGFKVQPQSGNVIAVDVAGLDGADLALGLAKYYYVTEVFVGKKVWDALFPPQASLQQASYEAAGFNVCRLRDIVKDECV